MLKYAHYTTCIDIICIQTLTESPHVIMDSDMHAAARYSLQNKLKLLVLLQVVY